MSSTGSNDIYQAPSSVGRGSDTLVPCVGCGKDIHFTASTCPSCGASQRTKRYKSKVAAALLAFFLGGFGAHRFYLGQWWGVFYLFFFWAWIPGLIAFIEFIVFLCTNQKKWDDKYNESMPAAANESGSGVAIVIALVFGGFFVVAILGILAAVAIPAYQDYTVRAKVGAAIVSSNDAKMRVQSFYEQHEVMPSANVMVGLSEPLIIEGNEVFVSEQGVELVFGSSTPVVEGETILFTPIVSSSEFDWGCTEGTLDMKYRPSACR